jgi:hypothetical protein
MFNPPSPRRSSTLNPNATGGYQPPVHPQALLVAPQATPTPPLPQSPPAQPQSQTQAPPQPARTKRDGSDQSQLQRVIPPEEDMQRLLQECRFAHGNAQVLSEALAFASPEDLEEKDIVKVGVYI